MRILFTTGASFLPSRLLAFPALNSRLSVTPLLPFVVHCVHSGREGDRRLSERTE